jgi:hypothetical protein
MHKTGITRGAAASHTAWANRYAAHPAVIAALAAGELSESWGADHLPVDRQAAGEVPRRVR